MLTEKRSLPLAALALMLVAVACSGAFTSTEIPASATLTKALPAESAYQFTLPGAADVDVSLGSYAGKRNVVLVFYRGFW